MARIARRDGLRCIHCGTTDALTCQHRGVKGTGGRNSAERPSNGIILCWALNVAIEQDAELAAWAEEMGWKISTHADPTTIAVYDTTEAAAFLLDDAWNRVEVA